MPNWSKAFSEFFLPLIDILVATFNETGAPTFKNYVAEQGTVMPNWSKTFQTFRSHSCIFALEKQSKNLNFQSFFTSRRHFGGYFQWNACIDYQNIWSSTRHNDVKLIKNISNFLVALLRFCYRKTTEKSQFPELFYL